ncbi:putative protein-serine/threonine phosphatase [Helianthus annuus]|nr:putative protein-serine/threonine phosphatase [Helianthus annuus]
MSLVDESPVNSSSSDDFAAFLDAELDSTSDTNPQQEEEEKQESDDDDADDNDDEINAVIERTKRRKISVVDDTEEPNGSTSHIVQTEVTETSVKVDICIHPGFIGGMCIKCGEKTDDDTQSSVAFGYIHKDLRLANDEIARLRDRDLKNLLRHKKLYLVLDLDHTLLNSTRFSDLTQDEGYLLNPNDPMQGIS